MALDPKPARNPGAGAALSNLSHGAMRRGEEQALAMAGELAGHLEKRRYPG